jgi:hypothetical protein
MPPRRGNADSSDDSDTEDERDEANSDDDDEPELDQPGVDARFDKLDNNEIEIPDLRITLPKEDFDAVMDDLEETMEFVGGFVGQHPWGRSSLGPTDEDLVAEVVLQIDGGYANEVTDDIVERFTWITKVLTGKMEFHGTHMIQGKLFEIRCRRPSSNSLLLV